VVYTWDATWSYWHTPAGYQNWLEASPDPRLGPVWTLPQTDMSTVAYSDDRHIDWSRNPIDLGGASHV